MEQERLAPLPLRRIHAPSLVDLERVFGQ
jgi:hypothetical protein